MLEGHALVLRQVEGSWAKTKINKRSLNSQHPGSADRVPRRSSKSEDWSGRHVFSSWRAMRLSCRALHSFSDVGRQVEGSWPKTKMNQRPLKIPISYFFTPPQPLKKRMNLFRNKINLPDTFIFFNITPGNG